MRVKKICILPAAMILAAILAAGCKVEAPIPEEREKSPFSFSEAADSSGVFAAPSPVQEIAAEPVSATGRRSIGSGSVAYGADVERLSAQQERLLLDYMDLYYQSLADLRAGDPGSLFAEDAREQAFSRMSTWQVIVEVRGAQKLDLSLSAFSYTMNCTDASIGEDGDLTLSVSENAVQGFKAFPGVGSESHNVRHRFVLTDTADGWKLRSHMQMDSANMVAFGRGMWRGEGEGGGSADIAEQLVEQRENVLSAHRQNLANRNRQLAAYDPEAAPALTWTYGYDREAAVTYAMEWVEKRNTDSWPTYDRNGGNCTNFTSQCLLAGGIPMDHFGSSQWKWYGSMPNTTQGATGRSGSWSGVNDFYSYVKSNTGYGMVAEANANYWSGEPGDLIQLGYGDNWRHVVIITDVIKDENGDTLDYLINSNTADQRSYPVSAYLYPQHRLIKIFGWNES